MINWVLYLVLVYVSLRGAMQRPEWLLVATVFFIPLTQAMPFPIGAIGASANILLGCLLVAWIRDVKPASTMPSPPLRGLVIGMMLFIVWGMVNRYYLEVMQGFRYLNDMEKVYGETKEALMGFTAYFLIFQLVKSREVLTRMWWGMLLCAGGECSLAVYERLQGIGRATAHLAEPNRAGGFFASAMVTFLALALIHSGRMQKIGVAGVVVGAGALFASLSRGALVAAAASTLLILIIFYTRVRSGANKLGVALLVLIATINISLLLPERVMNRIMFTFEGGSESAKSMGLSEEYDQSTGERLAIWNLAIDVMWEHPMGIGFYTFPTEVSRRLPMAKVAHNIYLTVGAEFGILALGWLLALVAGTWWKCWVGFREAVGTDEKALSLGLLGSWTALVVSVCFINPFFAFNYTGQFWVLMAARMKILSLDRKEATEAAWRQRELGRQKTPESTQMIS